MRHEPITRRRQGRRQPLRPARPRPALATLAEAGAGSDVLFVPGGGPTADVIRDFDRIHQLGEEQAHWLALAALQLNADFLVSFYPRPS